MATKQRRSIGSLSSRRTHHRLLLLHPPLLLSQALLPRLLPRPLPLRPLRAKMQTWPSPSLARCRTLEQPQQLHRLPPPLNQRGAHRTATPLRQLPPLLPRFRLLRRAPRPVRLRRRQVRHLPPRPLPHPPPPSLLAVPQPTLPRSFLSPSPGRPCPHPLPNLPTVRRACAGTIRCLSNNPVRSIPPRRSCLWRRTRRVPTSDGARDRRANGPPC